MVPYLKDQWMEGRKLLTVHLSRTVRPGSVDSLNGGSTDAMKKAPVEKKNGHPLFLRNQPTVALKIMVDR